MIREKQKKRDWNRYIARGAARQCASVLAGEARRSRGCVRLRASQRGGVRAEMPGQAGNGASSPAPCASAMRAAKWRAGGSPGRATAAAAPARRWPSAGGFAVGLTQAGRPLDLRRIFYCAELRVRAQRAQQVI